MEKINFIRAKSPLKHRLSYRLIAQSSTASPDQLLQNDIHWLSKSTSFLHFRPLIHSLEQGLNSSLKRKLSPPGSAIRATIFGS